jgi:hypothetical protein
MIVFFFSSVFAFSQEEEIDLEEAEREVLHAKQAGDLAAVEMWYVCVDPVSGDTDGPFSMIDVLDWYAEELVPRNTLMTDLSEWWTLKELGEVCDEIIFFLFFFFLKFALIILDVIKFRIFFFLLRYLFLLFLPVALLYSREWGGGGGGQSLPVHTFGRGDWTIPWHRCR